ncbi:UDP-glycosyltransferase UGT5-like isoform X2 [Epargyreus clarus]|uniref:UDP-glycosyltransferase UGT5-like isoform X1 n=1 Tax=Epargyreus clarus TaxID=520877 RepID=UPI003C2F4005
MVYVVLLLFTGLICSDAANVLVINAFTAKSHYISIRPVGLELARRGHNVTVITANKEDNPPPNYHQVMVDNKFLWDVLGTGRPNIFSFVNKTYEEFLTDVMWTGGYVFTEVVFNSASVKEFLKKDNKFDLVISEQFILEALNILAYKYKAPLVLVATVGNCMKHNLVIGNPLQFNTVIHEYLALKNSASLLGRLRNIYATVYEYVWWKYWYLGKHEALIKKHLPDLEEPVPSLYEVQKNVSLFLINSHFSFDTPMALLPNLVEVGGMHLSRSDADLPKDLQDILDKSKHGVIYMNFGSNVVISEMDEDKKIAFFNVFRKLKQTILMKWEEDVIENKPDNVIVRKWFPQKEIFAHPNIKVFISHGGLIGTQEALFHGIPILGVPVFADQYNNLELAEQIGFGKILEYNDINEKTLGKYLNEMLNDDTYKLKAEEVSQRFKDRPMSSLDTAMWWIEYVIRHKGADFMKSKTRDMSWFKYFMLDIYLVIIVTIVALISLMVIVVKTFRRLFRVQVTKKLKQK